MKHKSALLTILLSLFLITTLSYVEPLYSKGQKADEARTRIEKLHFKKAKNTNTIKAYKDFLKKYPQGLFSDKARSLIENFYNERHSALRNVKAVRIIVTSSYGEAKGISLPFKKTARKLLEEYAGVEVVETDAKSYDATLKIDAVGKALGKAYGLGYSLWGTHYSGATLSGTISVKVPGIFNYEKSFEGKKDPPGSISSDQYTSPSKAPFDDVFEHTFMPKISEIMGDLYGPNVLITIIRNWRDFFFDSHDAAEAFGNLRGQRVIDVLITAGLKDNSPEVQELAAFALGNIGDERAVEPLIAALKDGGMFVQYAAANALDKIGWSPSSLDQRITYLIAKQDWEDLMTIGQPAFKPLVTTLKDGVSYTNSYSMTGFIFSSFDAERVMETMVKIDAERAFEPLIAVLNNSYGYNDAVRGMAVKVLGKISDKRVVKPLIDALRETDQYVSPWAAFALGNIGDERAVEPLIAALKHVPESAAEALGKIGDKRAVKPLLDVLNDENIHWDSRRSAAEALGKIGDKRAVKPLIDALKYEYIREDIAEALRKITGKEISDTPEEWQKWWKQNRRK